MAYIETVTIITYRDDILEIAFIATDRISIETDPLHL
jgi:hypothetical protein